MRLFRRHDSADSKATPTDPDTTDPDTTDPDTTGPDTTDPGPTEPTLERLTNDEIDWVRSNIAALAEQDVILGNIDDLGRHYDELLTVWCRLSESQRPDPGAVTTQIGLGFGQYVADHAKLDWVVATDQHGSEIALYRPRGNVRLYPTTLVAEQWAAHEAGVLPGLARSLIAAVEELP